jgi:hypothetical protein
MLYAILCYHDEGLVESWTKEEDAAVLAKRHVAVNKLRDQGKLGPVVRLMPTTAATSIRNGKEQLVLDGPFAETKEQLLGLYIVDCESLDEVLEAARIMGQGESGTFEIRPLKLMWPDSRPEDRRKSAQS